MLRCICIIILSIKFCFSVSVRVCVCLCVRAWVPRWVRGCVRERGALFLRKQDNLIFHLLTLTAERRSAQYRNGARKRTGTHREENQLRHLHFVTNWRFQTKLRQKYHFRIQYSMHCSFFPQMIHKLFHPGRQLSRRRQQNLFVEWRRQKSSLRQNDGPRCWKEHIAQTKADELRITSHPVLAWGREECFAMFVYGPMWFLPQTATLTPHEGFTAQRCHFVLKVAHRLLRVVSFEIHLCSSLVNSYLRECFF